MNLASIRDFTKKKKLRFYRAQSFEQLCIFVFFNWNFPNKTYVMQRSTCLNSSHCIFPLADDFLVVFFRGDNRSHNGVL